MAIVEIYVDPSIDADSGAGTVGDPYGDLEYALEQTTPGTDGDRFNIKAGTAEVLEFALDVVTDYGTPTAAAPLVFQGYTSVQGDIGPGDALGEISGGASVSIIDATTLDYVMFFDLKLGNCGSAKIINLDNWCGLVRCEVHTSSHANPVEYGSECILEDFYFHTFTTAAANVEMLFFTSNCFARNGFLDGGTGDWDGAIKSNSAFSRVENCIVKVNNVNAIGIKLGNRNCSAVGNSVYNAAAGTETGISFSSAGAGCSCFDNIVEGWSGTGGSPIEGGGQALIACGGNIDYNCTDGNTWVDAPLLNEANTTAAASPFTDAANDDFTVTTEAQAAAFVQVFRGAPLSTNIEDAGACQRLESGGGGMRLVGTGGGLITPG